MGLFSKIAKGAGLFALGAVSPGTLSGYLYARDTGRAEDISALKADLDELLKATAEQMDSDESSEFLTHMQNAAMNMINDHDTRKTILKESAGLRGYFVNNVCRALLETDAMKNAAKTRGLEIDRIKKFMVTLPRALVVTAEKLVRDMNVGEGKVYSTFQSVFARWLVMPKEILLLFRANESNLESTVCALMFTTLESPELVRLVSDAGCDVATLKGKLKIVQDRCSKKAEGQAGEAGSS